MNAGWELWPRISWNPPDFTLKSGGFHPWNPVDFTQISPVRSTQNYKSKCFSKSSSVWWMQGGGYDQGFHEIHMKSAGFHELWAFVWWSSIGLSTFERPNRPCKIPRGPTGTNNVQMLPWGQTYIFFLALFPAVSHRFALAFLKSCFEKFHKANFISKQQKYQKTT